MSASQHHLDEENSYKYEFELTDSETGARITLAQLTNLYCTQFYYNPNITISDPKHLATINSRFNQNVKNNNNVVVSATGTVTWTIQKEDTARLNVSREEELHIALFVWTYSGGKRNSHSSFNTVRHIPFMADIP